MRLGAAASIVTFSLLGCASEPSTPIHDWTLHVEGKAIPVRVPARVEEHLPAHTATVTMTARCEVPRLVGKRGALVIPGVYGLREVLIDGESVPSLDSEILWVGRVRQHAFTLPAHAASDGVVEIEMRFTHVSAKTADFFEAPRIVESMRGDAQYRWIRQVNDIGATSAIVMLLTLSAVHAVVFFLNRTRAQYGWFAAFGGCATVVTATYTGLGQVAFGASASAIAWTVSLLAVYVGVRFYRASFGLPTPKWFGFVPLFVAVPWLIAPTPMQAPVHGKLFGTVDLILLGYGLTTTYRAVRLKLRGAIPHALALAVFSVLATPDMLATAGIADPLRGLRLLGLAYVALVGTTALLLARDHFQLQRDLEQRVVDLDVANVELRRQIGERSRALADALAKLGAVPAKSSRLRQGDVVDGRYRVLRPLGEGGMGAVFEVERTSDGARFAMKVLLDASTGKALARFAREAQVAAKIAHANVISVVDVGIADSGVLFVVMELVPGGSLEQQRERFGDRAWALPILRQIAEGLRALHEGDVIHRDLKPANVLLDREGRARLADFGIAALRGGIDELGETQAATSALTQQGALLGTPIYMAPELARGADRASTATDVFALGVVAYELLSGRAPFAVPPVMEALVGRTSMPPEKLGDTPIDQLISRALSPSPGERPSLTEVLGAC